MLSGVVVAVVVLLAPWAPRGAELVDYETAPVVGAWSLEDPWVGVDLGGATVVVAGDTIAQDAALVVWSVDSEDVDAEDVAAEDAPIAPVVARLDTRTGETAWSLELPAGTVTAATAAVAADGATAWLATVDMRGRPALLLVDLADGAIRGRAAGLEFVAAPGALDGDAIARDGATVGRYSREDLAVVWSAADAGEVLSLGPTEIAVGDTVLALEDGAPRAWSIDAGTISDVHGALLLVRALGPQRVVERLDPASGAAVWSIELSPGDGLIPVDGADVLIRVDAEAGELSAVDLRSGARRWVVDGTVAPDGGASAGSGRAGLVLVPIAATGDVLVAVELATGQRRFELGVGGTGAAARPVIGFGATSLLLGGDALESVDLEDGAARWTVSSPDPAAYDFEVWGGRIVAVAERVPRDADGGAAASILGVAPARR